MPPLHFDYKLVPANTRRYGRGYSFFSLTKTEFDSFGTESLGLGDISREGEYLHAVAAICDLEGFTTFCNQVDSHLVIPEFLTRYLGWFFETLKTKFRADQKKGRVAVWGSLPAFVKFMGDGLLLLWDTRLYGAPVNVWNIAYLLEQLTTEYVTEFYPDVCRHVSLAPTRLRCGVARGQIISVGDNGDYVGSCINIAARLQKLHGLSFALSRRGFEINADTDGVFPQSLSLKKVELRGISDDELVYVKTAELGRLSAKDRRQFRDPAGA